MNKTIIETLRGRWLTSAGGAVLLAGTFCGVTKLVLAQSGSKGAVQLEAASTAAVARDGKFLTSFAPLVQKVAPSVVKVSVTVQPKTISRGDSEMPDFWRFFGAPGDEQGFSRQFKTPKQHGVGSGVIVT